MNAKRRRPYKTGDFVEKPPENALFDNFCLLAFLKRSSFLSCKALSLRSVKNNLSESDALRRYLDKLVLGDELYSLLERELNGCYESELFVSTG